MLSLTHFSAQFILVFTIEFISLLSCGGFKIEPYSHSVPMLSFVVTIASVYSVGLPFPPLHLDICPVTLTIFS